MAQLRQAAGVVLNQQLATRKVSIPRFPSRTIISKDWVLTQPQLTAAIVSQRCKTAWSEVPDVVNADNHPDNKVDNATRARVATCNKCVALLTASFALNPQLTAIIIHTMTNKWPNGQMWLIYKYKRLHQRFMQNDKARRQRRIAQMTALEMNTGDNPQNLFDAIQVINRYEGNK